MTSTVGRMRVLHLAVLCASWSSAQAQEPRAAGALEDGSFPAGFQWGVASAAYQVEGAWNHSDKGESIWDRLVHARPELIAGAATGDVAADSFHRAPEDAQLAADLGVHFYRISLSWPRLLPSGLADGVSAAGRAYYDELLDELRACGVMPLVTLYHWDLPQRLQDLGGWANPAIVDWFADYARVAFTLFADRVPVWLTLNEPLVICDVTYAGGFLAPAILEPELGPHLCAKNVLLAHAAAWRIYDQEFRHKYHGKVSLANHAVWLEPDTDSKEDVEAAEIAMQMTAGRYSQPIFGAAGGWPASVERVVAAHSALDGLPRSRLPAFSAEEAARVRGTFDFYGLNHYTSRSVRAASGAGRGAGFPLAEWAELPASFHVRPHWPSACNQWLKVNPEGLRNVLVWLKQQYGDVPVLITESGFPTCEDSLDDLERVDYYRTYLRQVLRAIAVDGVNVTGYSAWTLFDNFEWMDGYNTKFGLYAVDFSSPVRTRTPRRSARYYAQVIKLNSLDVPDDYYKDEL